MEEVMRKLFETYVILRFLAKLVSENEKALEYISIIENNLIEIEMFLFTRKKGGVKEG